MIRGGWMGRIILCEMWFVIFRTCDAQALSQQEKSFSHCPKSYFCYQCVAVCMLLFPDCIDFFEHHTKATSLNSKSSASTLFFIHNFGLCCSTYHYPSSHLDLLSSLVSSNHLSISSPLTSPWVVPTLLHHTSCKFTFQSSSCILGLF